MPSKVTTPYACPNCGEMFYPYAHQVKRGGHLFCSRRCFNANFPTTSAEMRFWAKVDRNGPVPPHRPDFGACWVWRGGTDMGGYGQFRSTSRAPMIHTHKFSLSLVIGTRPEQNRDICHVCDVRNCVRNDSQGWYEVDGIMLPRWGHLFLGTASQNARDAIAKGRRPGIKRAS